MVENSNDVDLMVAKTIVMLEMQDDMNARVDRDWLSRNRAWYRAIWIECAELMDHYGGWKWWKESSRDVEQSVLEIVDIWHFGLSMRISPKRDYAAAARQIIEEWMSSSTSDGFLSDVEALAAAAVFEQRFAVPIIPCLLQDLGQSFDDLYRAYVGKNVLNFFRQDHGYRDGSYIKTWQGREDNEHLVDVAKALDADSAEFKDQVYAALKARYPSA